MSTKETVWAEMNNDNFRKRSSIRTKIVIAVVMVALVTASLITVVQVRTICRDILIDAQMQSEALAMPVKQSVDALLNKGPGRMDFTDLTDTESNTEIQKALGKALNWPGRNDLAAAYITNEKGKVLIQVARKSTVGDVPGDLFESRVKGIKGARIAGNGSRYDTFVPYYQKAGQVAGYLVIGISSQGLWDRATQLATGALISFAIISVVTVSVLGLWVSRYMIRPLERITEGIVHGAKSGRPRLGQLARSPDEIGQLAEVTNRVMPELYQQQQQLKATGKLLTSENTKLERTKRALMEMERFYRSAVEAATGVAYELDLATGKFEFLSRQVYDMLGFAAEDLGSSDIWSLHIHEDDRAKAKEDVNACLEGQKSCFSRSYRFVCKDGHELEVVELGGLISDESGRPSRISGIIIPAYMLPKSLLATS